MEAFGLFLLKSVSWLTGFALVYWMFLRNERFFFLNRIYLLSGVIASLLFPFISIHYRVVVPAIDLNIINDNVVTGIRNIGNTGTIDTGTILLILYVSGGLIVTAMLVIQNRSVLKTIKKAEVVSSHPVKLIRTAGYSSSFSFFSYVIVNPSVTDIETREIMNHELAHIRQKHWFDLVLVELLCIIQWFNPLIWIYVRFIRQNHEYLADEVALQRTSDPAVYKATLLNQVVGFPVVCLTNSFNYSLNKKRFNMMKNIINSPYRKMKILLILPVFAIVLYAFAKPDYKYISVDDSSVRNNNVSGIQSNDVRGIVTSEEGEPMEGAAIVVKGTAVGCVSDANGTFKLENLKEGDLLVVSFIGYKTEVIKPVFNKEIKVKLTRKSVITEPVTVGPPPPPPPPPSGVTGIPEAPLPPPPPPADSKIMVDGTHPLVVIDGIITDKEVDQIDPETIFSVNVLTDKPESGINPATDLYGEKGKNGVIEITTKQNAKDIKSKEVVFDKNTGDDKDKPFVVVEAMPVFPGGASAMQAWIAANIKYPVEAAKMKISGMVSVNFVVSKTGKVENVKIRKSVNSLLDAEAARVVKSMPDWTPGRQSGKTVEVDYTVPVEFKVK
jgi:TonB family protein